MKYPGAQAYNEALQMAQVSILDPTLRSGRVETDPLGLPFGRTGSFAITFKIAAGGSNYAFRCFLQNRATIHERYDAISSYLTSTHVPYFVDFTYLNEGIRVDNTVFPTLRMSWAGGIPLGQYIQDHHNNTARMTALHEEVQRMALALDSEGLAHGDIQGGNLLISDSGAIRLVDYDGMYVPSIANLGAIETGHPNFQHPERASSRPFDANVDQFSFALLHTIIAALIERPILWAQLKSDPDKFLLGASDIADPFSSSAFAALKSLQTAGAFAESLQAIAAAPYAQIPTFTDFVNQRNIPTPRASTRTNTSSGPNSVSGATPWYADHIPAGAATTTGAASGDVLGSYAAVDPVIDASKPYEWVGGRPNDVELIGKIESAELGESGRDLPYARLIIETGNPELTVDVWADGLRRFAEQGITIDDSWIGQWITARGIIQGPIGSPTGERYSMTITESQQLARINAQQARWRLATGRVEQAPDESTSTVRNSDVLDSLSGEASKPSPQAQNTKPGAPPPANSAPSNEASGISSRGIFWIVLGIVATGVVLILGVLLANGGLVLGSDPTRSGGGSTVADPQVMDSIYTTCAQREFGRNCEPGLAWEYTDCWQGLISPSDLELQRLNLSGEWVRARGISAVRDDCEPDYPWTVEFRKTEIRPGNYDYRIYDTVFGDELETISVRVTES